MATLRRISDSETSAALSLLAQSGGTARSLDSWKHDRMTALALGEPGHLSAVMPIARRTIDVAPNRTLNVGWLSSNQFASRMSLRRQTRETHPDWPTLLPELDALLVIRRDESSLAARWYAQTGFHDVLSIRCLYLDMTAAPAASHAAARYQVEVADPGTWNPRRWNAEMLAVYRDVYAATGGAPRRHVNFWDDALARHYYREHYQFQVIGLWSHSSTSAAESLMG